MVEDKEEIEQLFNKMMEVSGRLVKISPIYKKDMKDFDKIKSSMENLRNLRISDP
jgi:hypothetical protein